MKVRDLIARLRTDLEEMTGDTRLFSADIWNRFYSIYKGQLIMNYENGSIGKLNGSWVTAKVKMEKSRMLLGLIPEISECDDIYIYKSVDPLPDAAKTQSGFLYKGLTTYDGSTEIKIVTEEDYVIKNKRAKNLNKYAYVSEGHLYTKEEYGSYLLKYIPEDLTAAAGCGSFLDYDFACSDDLVHKSADYFVRELQFNSRIPYDYSPNKNKQ